MGEPRAERRVEGMRFNQLDLNLLVALDALLTERNITAAGVRLHLSQSAMSSALARLRDYFEDELLVQVGRKMAPTPLGDSLAGPVRKILIDIQTTIAAKPAFEPATSNRRFIVDDVGLRRQRPHDFSGKARCGIGPGGRLRIAEQQCGGTRGIH